MSAKMFGTSGSTWQSEWERDDASDTSSQVSESSGVVRSTDAAQRLRTLFNEGLYTDVKFVVSCGIKPKPEVLAHKAILAVGSPEFASMLYGNSVTDIARPSISEYEIKNVTYEAFRNIVEYLYTDDVFFERDSLVMETLSAAKKFKVDSLASRCESYFEAKEVTEANACTTLQLAINYQMEGLRNRATQFIQENSRDVLRSRDFKNCSSLTVRTICKFPRLNLESEQDLFFGVLDWIDAQSSTRSSKREMIEPFLKSIRFLTMRCEEFRDLVQKCPDIFTAEEALNLVMYLSNPSKSNTKLPSWCNKGGKRCFPTRQSAGTSRTFSNEKKMTIALKPTKRENLKSLACIVELKCMEGRHQVKGLQLAFSDPVTDRSVIGHMIITVYVAHTNYTFKEHIRIENSKHVTVQFTQNLSLYPGQSARISAEANEIKNYFFLQFDEENSFPEQSPFQCNLGSIPKGNRYFFISEIIYKPIVRNHPPDRRRPVVYRGNKRQ